MRRNFFIYLIMPRIKYEGDGAVFIGSFLEENEFAFIH
jgi:hypothetical protein